MRFSPRIEGCRFTLLLFAAWLAFDSATAPAAVRPSDALLPRSTVGYVSVARPAEMKDRWHQTSFGRMFDDEVMQPFVEDLRKQLGDKFGIVKEKLGITWDDLDGVPAGELSLAVFEREDRAAALAITIDVTGRQAQAERLLTAIEQRFAARGGRKETVDRDGVRLSVYIVPAAAGAAPQETVYFVKDNVLCGVDDRNEAVAILKRFSGTARDNLASVSAYTASMEKCRRESQGLAPELRWYVDPFGFVWAARSLSKTTRNRFDKDFAKILSAQGFDAIQGAGGYVNLLLDGGIEVLHRTAIHAPPVPGKENDPLRWNLAMRMMQLPKAPAQEPPSWAPRMCAGYSTVNLRVDQAFDNFGSLLDALRGSKGAWALSLKGWKTDKFGPQVDVGSEFIGNLGQRITLVTNYTTPITVGSERSLFAIEATNEKGLAEFLRKWMKNEPNVRRREFGQIVIWERVPPQAEVPDLQITSPVFGGGTPAGGDKKPQGDEAERERVLPNSAVCVALGHLMMASDVDYLLEILSGFGQRERLASSGDYQHVVEIMGRLAPGEYSGWSFGRTDEELRPTFELIRQGKMPQSESICGKLLNKLLTTEVEREEGVRRKQRIDGSRLPSFEAVRRYFGPAGRVLRSDRDGWMFTGAVLSKEQ